MGFCHQSLACIATTALFALFALSAVDAIGAQRISAEEALAKARKNVRGTGWQPDPERFGAIEKEMEGALKRLATRLTEQSEVVGRRT